MNSGYFCLSISDALGVIGRHFSIRLLNPMVADVGCEYIAFSIDGKVGHGCEPTVKGAKEVHGERATPLAHKSALAVEFLYPVVVAVGDVKYPLGTDYHIRGIVEFTCPDADLTGRAPHSVR